MCDTVNDEGVVPIEGTCFNVPDNMTECRKCHKQCLESDMLPVGLGEYECINCYYIIDDYES